MRRIRLVIADRRPIVLQGIVSLLGVQPDFEVVACCLDGASCLAAIRSTTPDVVLLEDGFTDVTASEILAVVEDEDLSSRLVFFTATVACGELARAIATGACEAISMDAKPEALVQSLRLERPGSDVARVGSEPKGVISFGNNVQALLTVNERTIMDLIAEGLSDSEIARLLGVSLEIVRIHIEHAGQKLGINSRKELGALALSRRYGAMSILAAAILAALDHPPGHAAPESFTIKAETDGAEVVIIKIGRKESSTGGGPARGANRERAALAGKSVDPFVEIAASPFALAALNESRPGSSSYSMFMLAAFAAVIYELDDAAHAAHAFNFRDGLAAIPAPLDVSDVKASAAAFPGFANLGNTAVYDESFAFKFAEGNTLVSEGGELHVRDVHTEEGSSYRGTSVARGSATVDVAAAAEATAQGGPTQVNGSPQDRSQPDMRPSDNSSEGGNERHAPGDDLNYGQSQKALRESDDGSEANGRADKEAPEGGLNHGQSQKALHESENSSGTAKEHAKHDAALNDLNHGQAEKALHESGNSSGAAKGHDKQEALGDGTSHPQSQNSPHDADNGSAAAKGHGGHEDTAEGVSHGHGNGDLHVVEGSSGGDKEHVQQAQQGNSGPGGPQASANDAHSASKIKIAGTGEPSSDDAAQSQSAVGTGLGDSFHFKTEIAHHVSVDIIDIHLGDGAGNAPGAGHHTAAQESPVAAQNVDTIDPSAAQHDHAAHVNLHAAHDLIV